VSLDIGAIREALATIIADRLDPTAGALNVYGYPPDNPELDAVLVLPRPGENGQYIDFHKSFEGADGVGGLCEIALSVEMRLGGPSIDAARTMDVYLGTTDTTSILKALKSNLTLSALVENVHVQGATSPARFASSPDDPRSWLACSWPITVLARR